VRIFVAQQLFKNPNQKLRKIEQSVITITNENKKIFTKQWTAYTHLHQKQECSYTGLGQ